MARHKTTHYPPEFRQQMVELVWAGRRPEELAREFEPSAPTIRNRVASKERPSYFRPKIAEISGDYKTAV